MRWLKKNITYLKVGLIIILIAVFIYFSPVYDTLWHMAIIPFFIGLLICSVFYER